MNGKQFKLQLTEMEIKIQRAVDDDLPKIIGNKAAQMFRQNFQEEGFFGLKWKEVKRRQPMTVVVTLSDGRKAKKVIPHAKGADGKRKILTGRTGNLGRSIDYRVEGKGIVVVFSDTAYGKVHNEGGMTGRGHKVRMPKRQFIGSHPKLSAELMRIITTYLDSIAK